MQNFETNNMPACKAAFIPKLEHPSVLKEFSNNVPIEAFTDESEMLRSLLGGL